MCVTSAVSDYYQHQWPARFPQNPTPFAADPVAAQLLREVLAKLEALDKRLGDIECIDESKKALLQTLFDSQTLVPKPTASA